MNTTQQELQNSQRLFIIKLNGDLKAKDIKQRSEGWWKISPKTVEKCDFVIVLNVGKIVAVYKRGKYLTYDVDNKRVGNLSLDDFNSDLVGETVDYKSINPATTITPDDFFARLEG